MKKRPKQTAKTLGGYLFLGTLLLGSGKAFCESFDISGGPDPLQGVVVGSLPEKGEAGSLQERRVQMVQALRKNQNPDPPRCDHLREFIEDYLSRSQSYQGLLALSAREFKTKILEEDSLSREEKEELKTDLSKSLVLLEDTELVLMDQAEWIRQKLPDCLKTSSRR